MPQYNSQARHQLWCATYRREEGKALIFVHVGRRAEKGSTRTAVNEGRQHQLSRHLHSGRTLSNDAIFLCGKNSFSYFPIPPAYFAAELWWLLSEKFGTSSDCQFAFRFDISNILRSISFALSCGGRPPSPFPRIDNQMSFGKAMSSSIEQFRS